MNRRYVTIFAVLAIGAILFFVGRSLVHRPADAAPESGAASIAARPNVPLATARMGDFVERIDAQGRVGPPAGNDAKLAFAQAGIVASVDVRVGATVRAGDRKSVV